MSCDIEETKPDEDLRALSSLQNTGFSLTTHLMSEMGRGKLHETWKIPSFL